MFGAMVAAFEHPGNREWTLRAALLLAARSTENTFPTATMPGNVRAMLDKINPFDPDPPPFKRFTIVASNPSPDAKAT